MLGGISAKPKVYLGRCKTKKDQQTTPPDIFFFDAKRYAKLMRCPNTGPCERQDYALGIKARALLWLFIAQRRYHRGSDPTYHALNAAAVAAAASWTKSRGVADSAGTRRR